MISKEKLLEISDLNLAGKIEQMNELDLKKYNQLLYMFTDNLPEQDKRIKTALDAKNYEALTKHLTAVKGILEKIYADEIAVDCAKQITSLGVIKHEKLDAYMRHYFLFNLASLAEDIQKADGKTPEPQKDKTANDPKNTGEKIDKDKLLAIHELKLAGKIEQMDDNSLTDYIQLLNSFTENYPEQEEKIKFALKNMDHDALKKQLSDVKDILEKIHADEMAQECAKQINVIGKTMHEKIEAFMRYFLSSLSMLSIDIQMAQKKIDLSKTSPNAGSAPADKKILAVDDTVFFQTILKKVLQDTSYKLTCFPSGREALKFLEKHKTDMFLLDIEMPGMDGFELAARIREKGHKEPIIFLTGNAKKQHLAKAMEAGATDFIIKPINKQLLLTKIRKYI
jgi:CheY-like chemotaxis protein/HPt (histidine-containing phosphotransfer) domain-containing protein